MEGRELNQGMLQQSGAFMFNGNIGWDSGLLLFGKISGKEFVSRKCRSLPEHVAQEQNEDAEVGRETGIEGTCHNKGKQGLIWSRQG